MKNGFSVLENYSASPAVASTRRAPLVAVEPVERKPAGYPSQRALPILAPIDLAGDSEAAVEHAIDIARAMRAELSILNVADPPSRTRGVFRRSFGPTWPISPFVVTGSVPGMITAFAEFVDADLVLMTSAHYRGWNLFGKRSVTADVIKSTKRPVLITGFANTNSRFQSRRILCALALDGTDGATVLQAEALARGTGGELMLLSAVPVVSEALLYEGIPGVNRPCSTPLAMDRIQEIGGSLSVPYKTSVMIGSLDRCIGLAARQYAADIVVASRYELDIRSVFRRLTCPLLSVASAGPGVRGIGGRIPDSPRSLEYAGDSLH